MMKRTNIETQLARLRDRDAEQMICNVKAYLAEAAVQEARIQHTLVGGNSRPMNHFEFDLLDTSRIYHLDQIRKICIDYRLRFLDIRYFKGKIPREGIQAIEALEDTHDTQLGGYKVMAPSRLFKLEDKDDPLLFAPMGNNYFYLVHKWGNDLHPFRKTFAWPFRNIVNLTLVVVFASYLLTLLVPSGLFSKTGTAAEFWIIFFFMFKSLASVVIFYAFALGKNFNPAIWNSKYFNA